jgi:hypothetical protein
MKGLEQSGEGRREEESEEGRKKTTMYLLVTVKNAEEYEILND